jgi:FtsP/CotA-like multicopper oxidase with cupredoxin domain
MMTLVRVKPTYSRREAISLGLVALGGLPVLAACAGDDDTAATTVTTTTSGSAPPRREELPPLPVHHADGDVLALTLTPAPATIDIGAAQPIATFAYDGAIPGAVWSLRPGQTLRIDLQNQLPPLDHEAMEMDRPHQWTTTNLHTHGLHVSPVGDGDNPFVTIEPGGSHRYEIEIPKDHTGGLFWYHPHRHGGVAQQIRGGMAGAIIVRGPIDEVPEVQAATERIVVIQGIELDDQFHVPAPIPDPSKTEAFFPRSQILYPINGRVSPTLTMRPGEIQRWRILNAAEGKFMDLVIPGVELHVLAWDGLTLSAPEIVPNLFLSPGNRVDVLVKATSPGRHDVSLTPSSSQKPGSESVPAPTSSTLPAELETRPIATVVVEGAPVDMGLPSRLPAFDLPILPIARRRDVSYTVERAGLEFETFGVDSNPYLPTEPPYQVRLHTAEEWTVVNGLDDKLPEHAHVFHIHVNPFKITKINGQPLEQPLWRDTFVLTGKTGDSFTFETNFLDFTGRFVDHCHIASHEDLGMMEIVEVLP